MKIDVLNYKSGGKGISVMRKKSVLGNPAEIGKDGTRRECIEKYRRWLLDKMMEYPESPQSKELRRLLSIARRRELALVCCCKPLPCHGDVIRRALLWLDKLI